MISCQGGGVRRVCLLLIYFNMGPGRVTEFPLLSANAVILQPGGDCLPIYRSLQSKISTFPSALIIGERLPIPTSQDASKKNQCQPAADS